MVSSSNAPEKWLIEKAGSLDRLKRVSVPLPAPVAGEVQVAVKAIGLNFADVFACLGLYSATPDGPFTPGLEFSGVVQALGDDLDDGGFTFRIGEPVMGMARFGAYATHLNVNRHYLHPLPEGWTHEQGAALPVQGLTAWYGLHELGNLSENQIVLVQSAAGGVGLQAMEMIQKVGARPIAVIGSRQKMDVLKERTGITDSQIIVRNKRFAATLEAVLAQMQADGIDIVLDAVYGRCFRPAFRRLNPMGRYVLFGAADMMTQGNRPNYLTLIPKYLARPRLDPMAMISDNRSLMAFNLIWLYDRIDLLHRTLRDFMASNPAPPLIGHEFNFREAPAAMRFFQTGHSVGKIILKTD